MIASTWNCLTRKPRRKRRRLDCGFGVADLAPVRKALTAAVDESQCKASDEPNPFFAAFERVAKK